MYAQRKVILTWKEKTLDCEIETAHRPRGKIPLSFTWKEKTLDCEIETTSQDTQAHRPRGLEKKRTSIARLKPQAADPGGRGCFLEKKRPSIARLKHDGNPGTARRFRPLKRKDPRLRDWNKNNIGIRELFANPWKEKNLDCEIETKTKESVKNTIIPTWKEKTLDCEIETPHTRIHQRGWEAPWKEKNLDCEIETSR